MRRRLREKLVIPKIKTATRYKMLQKRFQYLYVMNQSVSKESAHLCSFLEKLVFRTLNSFLQQVQSTLISQRFVVL